MGTGVTEIEVVPIERFDFKSLLSIDLIRVHTKTDDIPSVTDEQLQLYRDAAVESAEQYTGRVLSKIQSVTEPIDFKINNRALYRGYTDYNLKYPTTDGIVYFYGAMTQQVQIRPGTRKVRIPVMAALLDLSSACCRDNDRGGWVLLNLMALYKTGFATVEDIPKGIILGCLKYCAWCITHPGDELVSVRNKDTTSGGLMVGTNNIAFASGALELWRQYDPEAI